MTVNFNSNILNQLVALKPDKATDVDVKFPYFKDWRQNKRNPTLNQLSKVADYFNVPFGYFFINKIQDKEYPIPHYRTISRGQFKPSEELLDVINIVEQRQKWASYMLKKINHNEIPYANSVSIQDSVEETAQKIRDILDVHESWAKFEGFGKWIDAFKYLVDKIENAGVFVVINGVVGNNTFRPLNINEFRGFVLYDELAPFIFINGVDFVSARIFTLIHEFVHILIGKSASFDFVTLQPANNAIEEFCDAVAAEFLVSKNSLLGNIKKFGADYEKLANIYKVSQIVIARRLLDIDKIGYPDFLKYYENFKGYKQEVTKPETPGGDFYNNQPNRISKSFFNLLYLAVNQNQILYRDAFRLSGLSPKSFDTYIERYITKTT